MKAVSVDDSKREEEGLIISVGTTRITVWDAVSPDREQEIADEIVRALESEDE